MDVNITGLGVLSALLCILWYVLNKYSKKYWYIYQGKKKLSFLYHGVALCYEQLEMDEKEESIPKINDIAKWKIDNKGHGILQTNDYVLRTNVKGGTDIILKPLNIESMYKEFAQDIYAKLVSENQEFLYDLKDNYNGSVDLFIGQEIIADPTESDARYYITGYYENSLVPKRYEVLRAYNKYKLEHPYNI